MVTEITCSFAIAGEDGGAIAMLNMANGFQKLSVDLQIAALNTNKHYISPENLPGSFPGNGKPLIVNINTDVKPFAAVRNLFSDKSYNVERFYSPAFCYYPGRNDRIYAGL